MTWWYFLMNTSHAQGILQGLFPWYIGLAWWWCCWETRAHRLLDLLPATTVLVFAQFLQNSMSYVTVIHHSLGRNQNHHNEVLPPPPHFAHACWLLLLTAGSIKQ